MLQNSRWILRTVHPIADHRQIRLIYSSLSTSLQNKTVGRKKEILKIPLRSQGGEPQWRGRQRPRKTFLSAFRFIWNGALGLAPAKTSRRPPSPHFAPGKSFKKASPGKVQAEPWTQKGRKKEISKTIEGNGLIKNWRAQLVNLALNTDKWLERRRVSHSDLPREDLEKKQGTALNLLSYALNNFLLFH